MEFWEGAILVVGGVWLVSHMANRQKQGLANVIGQSTMGSAGTSNESNLTNITNMAGVSTIAGEPLEAPQAPIVPPVTAPVQIIARRPVAMPVRVQPSNVIPFDRGVAPTTFVPQSATLGGLQIPMSNRIMGL